MISSERISSASADEINVIATVRLLWRYKYLIAVATLLCGVIAVYLALTATPIYRAEIIISEVRDNDMSGSRLLTGSLGGLANLAGLGGIANGGYGQEAQAFLGSYRLSSEFILRHKLLGELTVATQKHPSLWFAVKRFREKVLSIAKDKVTGITTLAIDWKDPVTAARWANEYVALANELLRARALAESNRNIAYLKGQIERTNMLELQRVMYDLIETQTKRLMLANGRIEYAFTVVDPSVPPEMRDRPRRSLMVLTGLVLGGFLGAMLAVVHNLWRRYREGWDGL